MYQKICFYSSSKVRVTFYFDYYLFFFLIKLFMPNKSLHRGKSFAMYL